MSCYTNNVQEVAQQLSAHLDQHKGAVEQALAQVHKIQFQCTKNQDGCIAHHHFKIICNKML